MNRDFDFDDIGKKTPYRVPEAFFDNLQQEVLRRSGVRRRFRLRPTVVWAACVAAAFVSGLVFMPLFAPEEQPEDAVSAPEGTVAMANAGDRWIYEMSDEELEALKAVVKKVRKHSFKYAFILDHITRYLHTDKEGFPDNDCVIPL